MTPKENIRKPRPPAVIVMGHVDHGKTTLLDTIRKLKTDPEKRIRPVTEEEAGGITQSIGAHEISHNEKHITFIDTPGHEAFSIMRRRGARVADVALLVVAADEGVKPQTKEVIENIKEAKLPFIVVVNKIDKSGANPEKVKNELAEAGLLVEARGGKIPTVEISAKEGKNIDELLDLVLLVAELEELDYDPVAPAEGYVLESHLDRRRGVTASLLVTNGTLRAGDILVCGSSWGRVKIMEDFDGQLIKGAVPSSPVWVIGLCDLAASGDPCRKVESEEEAERLVAGRRDQIAKSLEALRVEPAGQEKVLSLVVKADTLGSLEAALDSIRQIHSDRVGIKIVKCEVGAVGEDDIKFAEAAHAPVFAFRAEVAKEAGDYAEQKGIAIRRFGVIYELIDATKEAMSHLLEPEITRKELGQVKVLAIFRTEPTRMIVGGEVTAGKIEKGAKIDVVREGSKVGTGRAAQLQVGEEPREEVAKRNEVGILYEGKERIKEGDILEAYTEEKAYPEL